LAAATGSYFGTGDGVESGPFVSRIVVARLPNGGVSIDYEATSREQGLQHVEHSLLTPGPDSHDQLFIAHSESPYVTAMIETAPGSGRFEPLDLVGPYAMAVVIDVPEPDRSPLRGGGPRSVGNPPSSRELRHRALPRECFRAWIEPAWRPVSRGGGRPVNSTRRLGPTT
jgi:hypothetical protein